MTPIQLNLPKMTPKKRAKQLGLSDAHREAISRIVDEAIAQQQVMQRRKRTSRKSALQKSPGLAA
jgi:hypothetical protein